MREKGKEKGREASEIMGDIKKICVANIKVSRARQRRGEA